MQIIYRKTHTYKYFLEAPYEHDVGIPVACQGRGGFVELMPDGILRIETGYRWDGPSGLTFDTPNFMRGSLVHDCLYQFMREGDLDQSYRQKADALIRDICVEDGMSWVRSRYVYGALRAGGGPSARPKAEYPVIVAPR